MHSKYNRLDRFISKTKSIKRGNVRLLLAQKRILVDNIIASDPQQPIGPFNTVILDNQILQQQSAHYIMLHKPVGVVSATKDTIHKTVIDIINTDRYPDLHIAGRLDLNTSGLLLMTNDGKWSRSLSDPDSEIKKKYLVELENPIDDNYINAFAEGMYFPYENITTKPVHLEILSEKLAQVELTQGRYHQIKRMFGRFRNPVKALHRVSIGGIELCGSLAPGQYRELSTSEKALINQ